MRKGTKRLKSSFQVFLFHHFDKDKNGYRSYTPHKVVELLVAVYIVVDNVKIEEHAEHFPKLKVRKEWNSSVNNRNEAQ